MHSTSLALLGPLLSGVVLAAPSSNGPTQWTLLQGSGEGDGGKPNMIRQNDTICNAGSAQWTGTVSIDIKREMFFWYFESRSSPENDPLIIWLNGGPGASSLLGAFHEIGPCTVTEDGQTTTRSEVSWTEFANMLFIDQPIGVGFSDPQDSRLWTENLQQGAVDLDKFLDGFLRDYFPSLQGRPIHLAGESFGGKYCPVYADIMRRRFDSIILVNALISFPHSVMGLYDHFCAPGKSSSTGLGTAACEEMEEAYSRCEKQGLLCDLSYDTDVCALAFEKCAGISDVYQRHVVPGGQNPYDDRTSCIEPPMCGRLGMDEVAEYLNKDWVQHALGFEKLLFKPVNMDLNTRWATQGDVSVPSTREIARLLDDKQTPILVLNGNNDAIVSTEGTLRAYDSLLWSGHAKFQLRNLEDWYYLGDDGSRVLGGQFKSSKNLTLVTINEAGHMSPHDQPQAAAQIMQAWTSRAGAENMFQSL